MSPTVWMLNHYAVTPDLPGGSRHFDLGRQLLRHGYQVTIFASGFDHGTKTYPKMNPAERLKIEENSGVRFVWVRTPTYRGNDWRRIWNMVSYAIGVLSIAGRFARPDVIVGSSMHPFAVLAAWRLSRRFRVPFVFEVRDLWPQTPIDMGSMKATSIPARLLYGWERMMYAAAARVITLLPDAGQYIAGRGMDASKMVWIPNGVDLERFRDVVALDPSSDAARALARNRGKFKVLYAGAHGPTNGLELIVETARVLSGIDDVQFLLVGGGSAKPALMQSATRYGLNNISFVDPVPKSSIPALLKEADLLLFCLRPLSVYRYGISLNKSYDYLASGKPVLMVGDAASNSVVSEAGAGIQVPWGDPEECARAILRLRQLPEDVRQVLGSNGRSYVENSNDTRLLGARMAALLDEVLAEHSKHVYSASEK